MTPHLLFVTYSYVHPQLLMFYSLYQHKQDKTLERYDNKTI